MPEYVRCFFRVLPDKQMMTIRKITPLPSSSNLEILNKNSVFMIHIFIVIVRHQENRHHEECGLTLYYIDLKMTYY